MDRRDFLRMLLGVAAVAPCRWLVGAPSEEAGCPLEDGEWDAQCAAPSSWRAAWVDDAASGTTAISTGLRALDDAFGGLRPGQLVILGGRPGMGKTALATRIAEHVGAVEGRGVLFLSLDLEPESLMRNMLCARARVGPWNMRSGLVTVEDRQRLRLAANQFDSAPILVYQAGSGSPEDLLDLTLDALTYDESPLRTGRATPMTIADLRATTRRAQSDLHEKGQELGLVIVDYLQLVEGEGEEGRLREVAIIAHSLKAMAEQLRVPVIALSQLSRDVECRPDHRPRLADLWPKGRIAETADAVMLLYRDEVYNGRTRFPGGCHVFIAKAPGGRTGVARLAFDRECMRFDDLA